MQRLVALFRGALAELGKAPREADLERWAVLVHASMSGRGRSYHTVAHVFDVHGGVDAIGSLAILFHDTVYCEIDGGLPRALEPHLGDALRVEGDVVELGDPEGDAHWALVAQLFGFTPGQAVTFQTGLNELGSALLAVRALRSHLSLRELAEVVTCIEATIPFRPPDAEEKLARRLASVDAAHQLGLGAAGVDDAVRRAVRVANRDVGNFGDEDPAAFLSHTWELLPELNPTLRMPAYTLGEYRAAMAKMEGFLGSLDPSSVFRSYRGAPDEAELADLRSRGRANIARGARYLRQKLLSARLLESLAHLTGGDAPVSLFTGDLPSGDPHDPPAMRLETLLPPPGEPRAPDVDPDVLRLLREGRNQETDFDLRHSPLAAYLYTRLGEAASERALACADGRPLLEALPADITREIASACVRIAPTRAEGLRELIAGLGA